VAQRLVPFLGYEDAAAAIDVLCTAFGAVENTGARSAECELERRMHDNPWVIDGLFVEVEDVDAHHSRATEHAATILRQPEEPGIDYRIYTAEDLEGHRWMFGQLLPV
jgi:uncharacterized glyoxalase superfamily protein PhnB